MFVNFFFLADVAGGQITGVKVPVREGRNPARDTNPRGLCAQMGGLLTSNAL